MCEECNDVPVAKLKAVMNKCNSVYILCKTCNTASPTLRIQMVAPEIEQPRDKEQLLASLDSLLDKKVTQLEKKIEDVIEAKIGEKLDLVDKIQEDIKKKNDKEDIPSTYADKVNELPAQMRKIIKEVKNEEKIEMIELERRSRNIIIHNADEIGNSPEEVRKEDEQL